MSFPVQRRRSSMRRFLYLRLALLLPVLIAAFVFHVSGKDLAILRVVRIVLVVLVIAGAGALRARRGRAS